jgi:hypothetical protein
MARVAARVSDLEGGTLPPVCAKTGVQTDGYTKIRFSSAPAWTWILLLFGIFPFLIAQFFATVRIEAIVPMSELAQRRVTAFNRLFIGLVALSLAVIAVGIALDTSTAILVGLAMLLIVVVAMLLALSSVLPSGQISGEWVELSVVHERFAAELDRFYGRSPEPTATGWNDNPTVKGWVLFVGGLVLLALLLAICVAGGETQI